MSVTIQPLIQSEVLTNALVTYFTAKGNTRVDAMTLYNPVGNAAEVVTVYWVPSGGTASDAKNEIANHNCLPGEAFNVFGIIGHTLNPGDSIAAIGTAGSLVNLFASGTVTS